MAELLSTLAQVLLTGGYEVRLEAIDPTTGAAVTGVKVSNFTLYGETTSGALGDGGSAPVDQTAPEFVPIPFGELGG
jgi:hypothetical protein